MKLKWQKLASLAQEICTLWFQFFGAVFASKGYPFKNIFKVTKKSAISGRVLCYTCKLRIVICKVKKTAKIRNQYNQVPHLTRDTIWESDKNLSQTQEY